VPTWVLPRRVVRSDTRTTFGAETVVLKLADDGHRLELVLIRAASLERFTLARPVWAGALIVVPTRALR